MTEIPYFRQRARNKLKAIGAPDPILFEKTAFNYAVRHLKSIGINDAVDQVLISQIHDSRVAMIELVPKVFQLFSGGEILPQNVSAYVSEHISKTYSPQYAMLDMQTISVSTLRPRAILMLLKHLQLDELVRTEMEIYKLYSSNRRRYAYQVRSISFNLGKQSTGLLDRVRKGEVAPESMAHMDRRAMWPEFWARPENQPGRRIVLVKNDILTEEKTMLQCRKCKAWKVSYYEMQTRSADEPMTVFCECMACGARWKM